MSALRRMTGTENRDNLALMIGRIQIAHAAVEDDLRILWMQLEALTDLTGDYPGHLTRLVEQCDAAMKNVVCAPEVAQASAEILSAVRVAHDERNRLVHDVWLPDRGTGEYRSGKSIRRQSHRDGVPVRALLEYTPTEPIAVFEECQKDLRRRRWQLAAVGELLEIVKSPLDHDPYYDYDDALTVARGDFTVMESGEGITWPS